MNTDAIISNGQWLPRIGDPTVFGWVITIAYFFAFILCLWAGISAKNNEKPKGVYESRGLLIGVAILLLLFGINKQIDLQTLLTIMGRQLAKAQGWYNIRRSIQLIFVVLFTLIVLLSLAMWARWMKRRWRQYGLHFAGIVLILLFVMIRAASFEHVFFRHYPGHNAVIYIVVTLLELVGILIVGLGSVLCLHRTKAGKYRNCKFDWK